jgi:hypothetical protein
VKYKTQSSTKKEISMELKLNPNNLLTAEARAIAKEA